MVNQQVEKRGGYHAIRVKSSSKSKDTTDMFIGRFDDGKYHLLGYGSTNLSYLFSEASETNQDLGVIELPRGKDKLSDLVKGEVFSIKPSEGDNYFVTYEGTF